MINNGLINTLQWYKANNTFFDHLFFPSRLIKFLFLKDLKNFLFALVTTTIFNPVLFMTLIASLSVELTSSKILLIFFFE